MILDNVNPDDLFPTEKKGPSVLGVIEYNVQGQTKFEGAFIATNERLIMNVDMNGQFYYRDVNLVIAVFDLTNMEQSFFHDCLQWINDFHHHHHYYRSDNVDDDDDVKIMIVGNKLDSNIGDISNLESIEKYSKTIQPNIRLYCTSALTMEGTEQLFEDITKQIIDSYCRKQQREQMKNNNNISNHHRSDYISYDHHDSIIMESKQQQTTSWLIVSNDLSISSTKLYDDADYDPFNGQLMNNNGDDDDGGGGGASGGGVQKSNLKQKPKSSLTFALFLRKLFCLI